MWGYVERPAPTVTGGGGSASGIEIFDQQSRKKMLREIEEGTMEGNNRTVNPATPLDPIRVTVEEAAALQSYPADWSQGRPAPTLVGTRRSEGGMLVGRQMDDDSRRDVGGHQTSKGLRDGMLPGIRVSGEEGATLQSYPPFIWNAPMLTPEGEPVRTKSGEIKRVPKTKQFLVVGNAVPPLVAKAVFEELWSA